VAQLGPTSAPPAGLLFGAKRTTAIYEGTQVHSSQRSVVPAGTAPDRPRVDNAMVKALARAFRWRKLLETNTYGTIEELAAGEKINSSCVSRILQMTLLAPDIVEAIQNGTHRSYVSLATMMRPLSADWEHQRAFWGSASEAIPETHTRARQV
jgi:hypothetical protein